MQYDHYHALHQHEEYERRIRAFQAERRARHFPTTRANPVWQRGHTLLQVIVALLSSIWQ